jgi:hypothetical protein
MALCTTTHTYVYIQQCAGFELINEPWAGDVINNPRLCESVTAQVFVCMLVCFCVRLLYEMYITFIYVCYCFACMYKCSECVCVYIYIYIYITYMNLNATFR